MHAINKTFKLMASTMENQQVIPLHKNQWMQSYIHDLIWVTSRPQWAYICFKCSGAVSKSSGAVSKCLREVMKRFLGGYKVFSGAVSKCYGAVTKVFRSSYEFQSSYESVLSEQLLSLPEHLQVSRSTYKSYVRVHQDLRKWNIYRNLNVQWNHIDTCIWWN